MTQGCPGVGLQTKTPTEERYRKQEVSREEKVLFADYFMKGDSEFRYHLRGCVVLGVGIWLTLFSSCKGMFHWMRRDANIFRSVGDLV
jgi:hypothetical protein